MAGDEYFDGMSPLRNTVKGAAAQGHAAEHVKLNFHLVEPARRHPRVMKANIRMLGRPIVVFIVGAVFVYNRMNCFTCRDVGHD